ncbi:YggT family protein [bacterium]|nr:YggT family protein [bacterium]
MILIKLLRFYEMILFFRIILSWVSPDPYNPIVRFLYSFTEPVLAPVRKLIPPLGGMLDLSPMIVFFVIELIIQVLA